MHQRIELGEDLASVTCVYDGMSHLGNFLGMYGIPPRGAINDDHGDATDDTECEREILAAWERG